MKGEGIRNLNETIENVRLFDVHTCTLQLIQRFFHTQIISIFDVKTQNHVNRFKFINKDKILYGQHTLSHLKFMSGRVRVNRALIFCPFADGNTAEIPEPIPLISKLLVKTI